MIPNTSILGAILLTGYLGGAIATHVRVGNPLFSHTLFPVYIALLIWGGLFLREDRLRALIPLRRLAVDVICLDAPRSGKIMTYSLENARLVEDGYATGEEGDYCSPSQQRKELSIG